MNQITQITSQPLQQQILTIEDGSQFSLEIFFMPTQLGWFITSLTYPNTNFTLNGMRIVLNPNMLFQFQNQIPFGLACYPVGNQGREPSQQQDFSSGAFQLYILTQAEVQQYTQILSGVPTWSSYVTYPLNYLVTYNGTIYESLIASNLGNVPTNTTYWGPA
jgi:hypothetical protein